MWQDDDVKVTCGAVKAVDAFGGGGVKASNPSRLFGESLRFSWGSLEGGEGEGTDAADKEVLGDWAVAKCLDVIEVLGDSAS